MTLDAPHQNSAVSALRVSAFSKCPQCAPTTRHHPRSVPHSCNHAIEDVRVLVVEDQTAVREAVAATFDRETGFTVDQARSLAEARGMLVGVDVAILDLGLPDGNGADLIDELHAVNPGSQAVVLTSSISPAVIEGARQRGAAAVLHKLGGFDALIETVKRLQRP